MASASSLGIMTAVKSIGPGVSFEETLLLRRSDACSSGVKSGAGKRQEMNGGRGRKNRWIWITLSFVMCSVDSRIIFAHSPKAMINCDKIICCCL